MRLITRVEMRCIRLYQSFRYGKVSHCRFIPRCDAYGYEALEIYGFRRGNILLVKRLLRCGPWGKYGLDPVPDDISEKIIDKRKEVQK